MKAITRDALHRIADEGHMGVAYLLFSEDGFTIMGLAGYTGAMETAKPAELITWAKEFNGMNRQELVNSLRLMANEMEAAE